MEAKRQANIKNRKNRPWVKEQLKEEERAKKRGYKGLYNMGRFRF